MKLIIKKFINNNNTCGSNYLYPSGKIPHFLAPFEMAVEFQLIQSKDYTCLNATHIAEMCCHFSQFG